MPITRRSPERHSLLPQINESDWRLFRKAEPIALDRFASECFPKSTRSLPTVTKPVINDMSPFLDQNEALLPVVRSWLLRAVHRVPLRNCTRGRTGGVPITSERHDS